MRLSLAAVAACVSAVQAFKETSPFLLFSNSPVPKEISSVPTAQLQTYSTVLETTKAFLKDCPSELYYIITQPSLSSSDLESPDSIPHLKRALRNPSVQSRFSVAEVLGLSYSGVDDILRLISSCDVLPFDDVGNGAWKQALREGNKVLVATTFDALPALEDERREMLADNDAKLHTPLSELAGGYKYTVIYTSTPSSSLTKTSTSHTSSSSVEPNYEPDFQNLEHLDLKRDVRIRGQNNVPATPHDLLPLFEKYQFLTPGLFMGLLAGLILLSILGVGISAISGLKVSYGAFEREMGPSEQKQQ